MSPNTQTTYILERHDQDDGSITYEIWSYDPEPRHLICYLSDRTDATEREVDRMNCWPSRPGARERAQLIVRALNHYDDLMKGKHNVQGKARLRAPSTAKQTRGRPGGGTVRRQDDGGDGGSGRLL